MVKAAIFDWHGTLAHWEPPGASAYLAVLASFGYEPEARVIDDYHDRWDGVDHRAHSTSRDAYVAWTRRRLLGLVRACGVRDAEAERVVEALLESDDATPMVPYPEAIPTVRSLRDRGILIGVCSNWGWDLETFLTATGVAPHLDLAVTSARAGFRKPHPGIYERTLASLGVEAADTVFIGDSWLPDVIGPTSVGMAAVHVLRRRSHPAPDLPPGVARVGALDELLPLVRPS